MQDIPKVPGTRINTINLDDFNTILEYLKEHEYTYSKDEGLLSALDLTKKNYKSLQDKLAYMQQHGFLSYEKRENKHTWKLKANKEHILTQLTKRDINNLDYAMELGQEYFTKDTQEVIKKIFASDPKLLGKFRMFEEVQDKKLHNKIKKLLEAIENKYYTNILLHNDPLKKGDYREIKPIKIVFTDDNWYLAFEYKDTKGKANFRLSRIVFIDEDIKFSHESPYSDKKTFQTKDLQKYLDFLENDLQNAMTLYGVEKKTVKLKAQGFVSQYFKPGMKKFFLSQKFVEELEDGSIIFTVEYTQLLEVLPFIQKWMPDLVILEPKELKEAYVQKLQKALENLS